EFFVERHAPSFVHILDYFQHGELHLPPDVCPYVFKRELEHWGIDPTVMSDCCQRRYLSFLDGELRSISSILHKLFSIVSSVVSLLHNILNSIVKTQTMSRTCSLTITCQFSYCDTQLAVMIGMAYDTGVETGSAASTTTTTNLPQDVFAVEGWISQLELACIVYFTIEFFLRLVFCPNKLRFIFNFFTVVDILSVVSMYVVLVLHHLNSKTKYEATYVDVINCLQVVRVFRFFRLVKDVTGFRVLIFSVRTSWRELLLLLLYIVMLVSIFASLAYYCERKNMGSILRAAWWAIVTMTTVGYGDIAPKTALGRVVGAACALSGVLLIAVTVPVFVNNFLLFYEH
ncbi:hypothetical protein EGW08_018166, partial [Elysia chlorotica]